MRNALPVMTEDAATLQERLPRERDGRQRSRLPRLYLLASGQAQTRQEVAQLLSVPRHPIGHWLARYAVGGLATLLDLYVPPGKPLSLPLDVLAALAQALQQPAGLASYEALRQGGPPPAHLEVHSPPSSAPHATPRARARGPVTQNTPDARAAWRATCPARWPRVRPPAPPCPVRLFRQADRRLGWLSRRRRTARGVQPVELIQHVRAWVEGDGAVASPPGERGVCACPSLPAAPGHRLGEAVAPAGPDRLNRRLSEKRGAHPAQRGRWPAPVRAVGRPPSGPERTPSERVWRDLNEALAWRQCTALAAPQASGGDLLQADKATHRHALTRDADVVEAMNAVCS